MSEALIPAQGPVDVNVRSWMPIETAPTTTFYCDPEDSVVVARFFGSRLLCWNKARHVSDPAEGKHGWFCGMSKLDFVPTHWSALPPAPNAGNNAPPQAVAVD